jgi:hypothetical protein
MSGSTVCNYLPPWIAGLLSGMSSTELWAATLAILILLGAARAIGAQRDVIAHRAAADRDTVVHHGTVHPRTGGAPPGQFPRRSQR